MRTTILGAGAFGKALEQILVANGHEVRFYDPKVYPDSTLEDATNGAEVIVCAIPSNFAPETLAKISNKSIPLINTSKGFLSLDVFKDFDNFSLLSGGSFAERLKEKKPTVLTATAELPERLFATSWLKVERCNDVYGVLILGSLKNIYAIGAGEKSLKPNTPEFRKFIKEALAELKFILAANGCDSATADLACGKLDLVMTCASAESRNFQFGDLLRRRNHIDISTITATTEGLTAAQALPGSGLEIPAGCRVIKSIIERVQDATQ